MRGSSKTSSIDIAEVITTGVKEMIRSNDFFVIPRDKNDDFIRKYRLNKSRIRAILLNLSKFDYVGETEDYGKDVHGDACLILFEKEIMLTDFHGIDRLVSIYIKIKEVENRKVPVISFHESEK